MLSKPEATTAFGNLISSDNLFYDLSPKTLQSLSLIRHSRHFQKGTRLFTKGESPDGVYILLKGQAQLFLDVDSTNRNFARLVEANEMLGLIEVLADLRYKTSAETITPCVFEFIGREDFIDFLRTEKEVCFRLAQLLGLNIQKIQKWIRSSLI
jgi:CRP/FNR family transcriptional regulator, cyclic AMP receptor protein